VDDARPIFGDDVSQKIIHKIRPQFAITAVPQEI